MQGNGDFVLANDPPLVKSPVKLELREGGLNTVCLVASLDDGTEAYLACYKKGRIVPFELSVAIAKRLGLLCNLEGTVLIGSPLPEKSRKGC